MKKIVILISCFLLLLTGCAPKNGSKPKEGNGSSNQNQGQNQSKNPKMVGVVKQISYKDEKLISILILDDKNSEYVFAINETVDFKEAPSLKAGNKVEIEHSGEIRESYPAQGTAIKVTILGNNSTAIVDKNLYSIIPLRAQYNEDIAQKTMNTLGVFTDVIDDKAKFDKYINEINFDSENKINLKSKYDVTFFQKQKLILIVKSTSSSPAYGISEITKGDGKLNVVMEENTGEMQTADITLKGFLIEINSTILADTIVNIQYVRKVTTK